MNKLTAISLFTGAGGMDIGFEKAGFEILWANELDVDASKTYTQNHPSTKTVVGDINNCIPMLSEYRGADIVFGGPPCQGFSVAGKMDPNDGRSKLIFSFLKAVEIVQPKVFVMENVKALAKLDKWANVRAEYFDQASKLGYTCYAYVLNATDYGVPQKRERVFFVGIKDDLFFGDQIRALIEKQKCNTPTIRELLTPLGKAGSKNNPKTCTAKITYATNPVMRQSPYAGMMFNGMGRPINLDSFANTLPASMGGNKTPIIDEDYLFDNTKNNWIEDYHNQLKHGYKPEFGEAPTRLRRLTIKEAALIQTFPEDYVFCGKKSAIYRQIGNAVPCKLAEVVARAVYEYLHK